MKYLSPLVFFCLCLYACSDYKDLEDLSREDQELELAIPVVNTEFNISDFTSPEVAPDNVSIRIDGEDRVTLIYNGDVVRQTVANVFPAIPFFGFPLPDTLFTVPIPFATDQRIDKATLGKTNLGISFSSQFEEDVTVEVYIPQLLFNGEPFNETYIVEYDGTSPVDFNTGQIDLEGWDLISATNEITVRYDARLADDTRVKFDGATMLFDQVVFDYIEGYFGRDVFDISGDFVPVGVLDNWVSGGLAFEDPKVNIFVENAFGFPVRSLFKKMQVVTTTGEMLDMESEIIDNNVDFAFPSIDEQGQSKITAFSFNNTNSNIVDLFKERVTRVTYDIDALVNADDDTSILQFVNQESFFVVKVDVELPLEGSINNLVLQDVTDIDLGEAEDVTSAELKVILANDFPADVSVQAYFLDENEMIIDSLFDNRLAMPAAVVGTDGRTEEGEEIISFQDYDEDRFSRIQGSKQLNVNVKINTVDADAENPLWIYNDYGIKMRIGAKLKTTL